MRKIIIISDDNGEMYTINEENILERLKGMVIERFDVISEKILIIKVKGVIDDRVYFW